MDTSHCTFNRFASIFVLAAFWVLNLTACGGGVPGTPIPSLLPISPTVTPTALPTAAYAPTPECTDNLDFLDDLTIADYSVVAPGSSIDKQWLVQNIGSCNWDNRYRLRLISGDPLGVSPEQALYPARSGTQAVIRILFTAPQEAGTYTSEWQAFNPDGIPMGDSFTMIINIEP